MEITHDVVSSTTGFSHGTRFLPFVKVPITTVAVKLDDCLVTFNFFVSDVTVGRHVFVRSTILSGVENSVFLIAGSSHGSLVIGFGLLTGVPYYEDLFSGGFTINDCLYYLLVRLNWLAGISGNYPII